MDDLHGGAMAASMDETPGRGYFDNHDKFEPWSPGFFIFFLFFSFLLL